MPRSRPSASCRLLASVAARPVRMNKVVVVGAGVAGLTCARMLGDRAQVTLVDRLPACGGVLSFDHPQVRELVHDASAAGVEFALGATATRWTGERLLIAAPHAIRWQEADHLVYAGGSRPSTATELGMVGVTRLAGILPAPVAVHLLEAGVRIGTQVALIGSGDWTERVGRELARHAIDVTYVSLPGEAEPDEASIAARRYAGWVPVSTWGNGRVSRLMLERSGAVRRLVCDAVVLAAGLRPLRNVDGAVEDNDSTTFVQHIAQHATIEEVAMHAREISQRVLDQVGGKT